MTPRERMLVAMTGGKPDRVPATPDISNMVPCRLTGEPFWEVYYFRQPPLWQAYIEAVRYFGIDGWFTYGDMQYQYPGERYQAIEDMRKTEDRWVVTTRGLTDRLPWHSATTYYRGDPPTVTDKPIEDLEERWDLLEKWMAPPVGYNPSLLRRQREELGDLGAFGVGIGYPGFQSWYGLFKGGLSDLAYWYYDKHDLVEALRQLHDRQCEVQMEMALQEKPDFILLGGSGTITLQSPTIAREISLPTIRKLTAMAKRAGVPTMLHSCGKERDLVRWCAEETDLDCINPLEIAPMGDCDLAGLKRDHGGRIALMGNLHTTEVMLRGSVEDVMQASRDAIEAAAVGGGFILSTGDQCGRDTPDENLRAMVRAVEQYGGY